MISASTRISVLVVCLSLRVSYSDTALVRTFDSRVELNAARQGARDALVIGGSCPRVVRFCKENFAEMLSPHSRLFAKTNNYLLAYALLRRVRINYPESVARY